MAQRQLFKKGQSPPTHREGCQCFRCTKIPWNKGLQGKQPYMNLLGLTGVKKHSETTKQKMREKALGRKHTKQTRIKISAIQQGILVNEWSGWKGRDRTEREKFYTTMRKDILKRDNYTCQMCGLRGVDLQVDHILSWAKHIELRFSMDNCRTLCMGCHYLTTFGKKKPQNVSWGHNFMKGGY